jgi:hypothetical protein
MLAQLLAVLRLGVRPEPEHVVMERLPAIVDLVHWLGALGLADLGDLLSGAAGRGYGLGR